MTLVVCSYAANAAAQDAAANYGEGPPPTARELLAKHGIGADPQSAIGALRNSDAEVRGLAALRLGDYDLGRARGDSIPALAEALRNETVPASAAIMAAILGGLGDARGVPALEKLCHDPTISSSVKLQVARHLGVLHSEACVGEVLDLAFRENDGVTSVVFSFLPRFQGYQNVSSRDRDRIVAIVRGGLSSRSPFMRLTAAGARGEMKDEAAAADLQRAIETEQDAQVRQGMQRALASLEKRTAR
jgi:HEAT repeat protein